MKVLLVNPIIDRRKRIHVVPPLGLGYLATAIRNKHEVSILDCIKKNTSFEDLKDYIKSFQPDVIGITYFSHNRQNIEKIINLIKSIDHSIITILGGPHPTAMPEETLHSFKKADFAFKGEAEKGLPILLDRLEDNNEDNKLDDIPGLIWHNNGDIVYNPQIFPEPLDELDYPSWDLLSPHKYCNAPHGFFLKQFPYAPIIISRGCSNKCNFCAGKTILGSKVRYRSISNVIEEIEILHNNYGIKEFHIVDDNFTFNRSYVLELCKNIIAKKMRIYFSNPNGVRLDTLDKEMLILMKEAGWYRIYVGIESGSQRILNMMQKELNKKEIINKIKIIKESGLDSAGYFIVGYPEETETEYWQTVNFARELNLDLAHFSLFIPLPGTSIFDRLNNGGKLTNLDWSGLCYSGNGANRNKGISTSTILRKAYLSFYLHFKSLYYLFKNLKVNNIYFLFKRMMLFLFS